MLPVTALAAAAETTYPLQPVRIIFPGSAGSSGDARLRVLADRLSTRLGQRFNVENKPGAGTTLGTMTVAAAKPDGYTLLATYTPAFPTGPMLYPEAGYDPIKSFVPIAMFSRGAPLLVINPSIHANTLKEFVALAKAHPGQFTLSHGGLGGANHLPAQMFGAAAGAEFLYVPYKGETQAMMDVIGGQVSGMFAYTAIAVPFIQAGKVKGLAVASAHRNASVPQVPTVAESGFAGFEFYGTMLLLGPAGMPKAIVATLNREIGAILQEHDVRTTYEASGADPVFGTPEETAALIRRETDANGALLRKLGITAEQ
ncbi:MAG TPA: tripartite tricarboxylate transporter substrate binding protein [Burkholderiales bacterium]|nr:tripartite tricarboxylate transporter substrate binding protein [Burkholderiales bacterium]